MIGRHLAEQSGGLLAISPEPEHRGLNTFGNFNLGGVEIEVGEFLYALARLLKPRRILETGTHWGISASFLGLACRENGQGKVTTLEIGTTNVKRARALLGKLGLLDTWVESLQADVGLWGPGDTMYGMILLDTELQYRFGDMVRFWRNLLPGGVAVIHDLHPHMAQTGIVNQGVLNGPFGVLPDEIRQWIATHEIQSFHLPTPRGLYVAQKALPEFHSTAVLRGIVC